MKPERINTNTASLGDVKSTTLTSQAAENARRAPVLAFTDSLTYAASKEASMGLPQSGLPQSPVLPPPTAQKSSTDPWSDVAKAMCDMFNTEAQATADQTKDLTKYQLMDQTMSQCVLDLTNQSISAQDKVIGLQAEVMSEQNQLDSENTFERDLNYVMIAVSCLMVVCSAGTYAAGWIASSVAEAVTAAGEAGAQGLGEGAGAGAAAAGDTAGTSAQIATNEAGIASANSAASSATSDLDATLTEARSPGQGTGPGEAAPKARGGAEKVDNSLSAWVKWGIHKAIAAGGSAACAVPQFQEYKTKEVLAGYLQDTADAQRSVAEPLALTQKYNMYYQYYQTAAQRKSNLVSTMTDQLCNVIKLEGSLMQGIQQISSSLGNVHV